MSALRRLYYRVFKRYRRLELRFVANADADALLRANEGKPESEQWVLAREEDGNLVPFHVFLERRERIIG